MKQYEVKVETRSERQKREREQWIEQATHYLIELKVYDLLEYSDARDLAESLEYHARDEGGEHMYTAKEAVDEEMTYWAE
jgi:hypothetical protein